MATPFAQSASKALRAISSKRFGLKTPHFGSQSRFYRGDSGEMKSRPSSDPIAQRESELLAQAKPRYDAIYERHVRLPSLDDIPTSSHGLSEENTSKDEMELQVRRKRLIYRSKQRGWLEVDLLLGTWASQNVPLLGSSELDEFEAFVNAETIDIYNILTLRTEVPEELKGSLVERIQDWARKSPLGKADPDTYKSVKRENNLI